LVIVTRADILPETPVYDADCRRCERLASFLDQVRAANPGYFCRPVPPFGTDDAALVIVGLAPGMHGANATGRPFTGDYAGILLYATLYEYGFASQPVATRRDDGLALIDCRITNAVKCLPPENKPAPGEVRNCNAYLAPDLARIPAGGAILALGRIAHDATLAALGMKRSALALPTARGTSFRADVAFFDSYHCSRYNTNTGRLTAPMFHAVFDAIAAHLGREGARRAA
jgi:uracil-DNA glycosylase family 4